jgi:uncharacterized protein YceH (UPF0502 family)
VLSVTEGRVLGCLLEKERTVPDQYPLTLSALMAACNQSTSRSPVMALEAHEVEAAATALKAHGWARLVHPTHGRAVVRFRQVAVDKLALGDAEAAVLAVLLLRGPQTPAEVRQHGERLHRFDTVEQVSEVLEHLTDRGEPLVRRLDRTAGHKGERWQQVIAEEVDTDLGREAPLASPSLAARVAELEERLERLELLLRDLL